MTIGQIAVLAHEANRAYCKSIGDHSQLPWDEAPDWQQKSALNGVVFHLANPYANANASHEAWFKEKVEDGWVYGEIKDAVKKEHPCIVRFEELPISQQIKDHIFRSIVHGAHQAFNTLAALNEPS
jgi:RyR domain